jgi:ribosomal-protein-alanine N-acetyltransferase
MTVVTDTSAMSITIEPMRRGHLRQVHRIEAQVHPRPWSVGLFLGELADRKAKYYVVARHDSRVVGYAGLLLIDGEAHVSNIAVDPSLSRQGLASRLMLALVGRATTWGCDAMTLEVRVSNLAAQHLYFNFGFSPVGVRKAYYVDNREDAVILYAREIRTPEYQAKIEPIKAQYGALMTVVGS